MKKINQNIILLPACLVILLLITCMTLQGQAPAGFNYQAVLRDGSGNLKANTNVTIQISILQGSATGTSVFSETHNTTTNDFGLVNLQIGSVETTGFAGINWADGPYFIKLVVDGVEMGTSQLLSVPYALYAASGVGEQGPKGDKGDTGAQGSQGPKGDKGDTGAQGSQGLKGDKGDKGDTGAQGLQGLKGDKGDKGDTGAQGPQGPKGDKGDKGDVGATGPAGPATTDASLLTSGTLNTSRYSAYSDLGAEGRINNDAIDDILLRRQSDERYNLNLSFLVRNNASYYVTTNSNTVRFNQKVFGGVDFSTSTYRYTAYVDGVYHISTCVNALNFEDGASFSLSCYVNGDLYCRLAFDYASGGMIALSGSATIMLDQDDYVDIRIYSSDDNYIVVGDNASSYTWFSGHLVNRIF